MDRVENVRRACPAGIVKVAPAARYQAALSAGMKASATMKMPLLDVAFYLMDSARSPQDFTLILHFNDSPGVDNFYAGAKSAMNRFPVSASCIDGQNWVWRENKYFKLQLVSTFSECETKAAIERFINERFDVRKQAPVKQALVLNGSSGAHLVTRFHHAAADGLSAALWLGHQLNVAYGLEAVEEERSAFVGPSLRSLSTSVRRSQFAFDGASDCLRTSRAESSGRRHWFAIGFPAVALQKACRSAGGFTYNDLLATCTLEVLLEWNSCKSNDCRIGLWVPMNIRRDSTAGFGNGTSRIRLYARYDANASLIEKCREIRRQVSWTSTNGEWVVPDTPWFTRLPRQIAGPLLRGYLNRRSVDMATAVFSHVGSWIANAGEAFKHVERIECVGLLHPRQRLAINAATHCGHTWLTFTYDPELFDAGDLRQLKQMYERQIAVAREQLS